ncbi:hypothetical protein ScPMuIL_003262 [Solemya velum]
MDEGLVLSELPYSTYNRLCKYMDIDEGWKRLASAFGYSIRQIMTLGLEYMRPNGSPTDKLLWDLCTRDVTVGEFQEKLSESNLLQGLSILHAGGNM